MRRGRGLNLRPRRASSRRAQIQVGGSPVSLGWAKLARLACGRQSQRRRRGHRRRCAGVAGRTSFARRRPGHQLWPGAPRDWNWRSLAPAGRSAFGRVPALVARLPLRRSSVSRGRQQRDVAGFGHRPAIVLHQSPATAPCVSGAFPRTPTPGGRSIQRQPFRSSMWRLRRTVVAWQQAGRTGPFGFGTSCPGRCGGPPSLHMARKSRRSLGAAPACSPSQ